MDAPSSHSAWLRSQIVSIKAALASPSVEGLARALAEELLERYERELKENPDAECDCDHCGQ